jgi:hypothetical protein
MKKLQDYSSTAPVHTEQSQQYDECLLIVKTQIDIIVNANNCAYTWLNEVQAYLNRARDKALQYEWDQSRDHYEDWS